jgi:hypothetical protein
MKGKKSQWKGQVAIFQRALSEMGSRSPGPSPTLQQKKEEACQVSLLGSVKMFKDAVNSMTVVKPKNQWELSWVRKSMNKVLYPKGKLNVKPPNEAECPKDLVKPLEAQMPIICEAYTVSQSDFDSVEMEGDESYYSPKSPTQEEMDEWEENDEGRARTKIWADAQMAAMGPTTSTLEQQVEEGRVKSEPLEEDNDKENIEDSEERGTERENIEGDYEGNDMQDIEGSEEEESDRESTEDDSEEEESDRESTEDDSGRGTEEEIGGETDDDRGRDTPEEEDGDSDRENREEEDRDRERAEREVEEFYHREREGIFWNYRPEDFMTPREVQEELEMRRAEAAAGDYMSAQVRRMRQRANIFSNWAETVEQEFSQLQQNEE